MSDQKLRIGILGAAKIAVKSMIPAILDLPEKYILAGIASRDSNKALEIANMFDVHAVGSYDDILNTSLVDIIYIPLPNASHFEWVKKALERGLHVLVEKSLGCNLQEVTTLNKIANDKGLILVENFQFRFHSQLQFIIKLVNDSKIGELRCLRSSFGFPPFPDHDNIRYKKELGGGALLDVGAYPLKIAQVFLGYDLGVAAANLSIDHEKQVDIWGGAYLKQKTGSLFAEIAFGFDHLYQCNLELWGSKGKIYTNRIFTAPPGYSPEIVVETSEGKEIIHLKADHHFKNMLEHVFNLHKGIGDVEEEYQQNIHQARLIEELKNIAHG